MAPLKTAYNYAAATSTANGSLLLPIGPVAATEKNLEDKNRIVKAVSKYFPVPTCDVKQLEDGRRAFVSALVREKKNFYLEFLLGGEGKIYCRKVVTVKVPGLDPIPVYSQESIFIDKRGLVQVLNEYGSKIKPDKLPKVLASVLD